MLYLDTFNIKFGMVRMNALILAIKVASEMKCGRKVSLAYT